QGLVQADGVALLDEPLDDGRVRQALAQVGQVAGLGLAHRVARSIVRSITRIAGRDQPPRRAAAACHPGRHGHGPRRTGPRAVPAQPWAIAARAAATIRSTLGRYFISSRNSGMWVSQPVTRCTGATRSYMDSSARRAAISAPKPAVRGASCTITQR